MTNDRWHQVTEIFHAAGRLSDGAAREAYLDDTCGHDPSLRADVEALLAGHDEAGSFGERALAVERSAAKHLSSGTRLGPHEILRLVGAGGMGEVYEARDTRLDRVVAVKVLPSEFGSDPERRARFVREAKTIAQLNHPHICTLYDVGRHEDTDYLVMELLDGETLAHRLVEGPLPIDEALRFGAEIADALATAHRIGVVHRDLKPGNIMLTKAGAKLLDFGLAKLKPPVGPGESTTQHEVTAEGAILGTLQYMAPEQLEGRETDARTDLFAFGAVLYEMLTGKKAFEGESQASLIGAILHTDPPPVSSLQPLAPMRLERLVRTCLAKDPDARWQSAGDLARELTWSRDDRASAPGRERDVAGATVGSRAGAAVRRLAWAGATVAVALLVVWQWNAGRNVSGPTLSGFEPLTSAAAAESHPSISPDGQEVLYQSSASGNMDIWLHRVGVEEPLNLTADSPVADSQPEWSPDGERIAFVSARAGGGIFIMGPTGEALKKITEFGRAPAWSPDGLRIAFHQGAIDQPGASLWTVDVETRTVQELGAEGGSPAWSPNGRWIAYSRRGFDIEVIAAEGGTPIKLTDDAGITENYPTWSPDGRFIYFTSDRGGTPNIWRVRIDPDTGQRAGDFEPLTLPATRVGSITIARDAPRVAYAVLAVRSSDYYRVPFDPAGGAIVGNAQRLTEDSRLYILHDPHPDGEQFVLQTREPAGTYGQNEELFVGRIGDAKLTQITVDGDVNRAPRWSPDGFRIAFSSNHGFGRMGTSNEAYEIFVFNPGTREYTRLTDMKRGRRNPPEGIPNEWMAWLPVWSEDGRRMAFVDNPGQNVYVIDPDVAWSEQTLERLPDPVGWSEDTLFLPGSWSAERGLLGCLGEPNTRGQADFSTMIPAAYDFRRQEYTMLSAIPGCRSTVWLRNGKVLLNFGTSVFLVDPADRSRRELFSIGMGSPSAKLSFDDRYIYYLEHRAEPQEIFTADLTGSGGERQERP